VIETAPVAVELLASVTSKVGEKVPDAEGVPVIDPVTGSSDRPVGSAPDATLQEYGLRPPDAATEPEYGDPTVPVGREPVVTDGAGGGRLIRIVPSPAAVPPPTEKQVLDDAHATA
jgi:hypothetical protein